MKLPHYLASRFARRTRRQRKESERNLRETEIRLLRRQTWASWATVFSTALLTAALLTLTFFQWRTSESTAAIERAKARPHFRVRQENQPDELGFLPRRFVIEAEAGVSAATRASATAMLEIQYASRALGRSGRCRVSFPNFYGWTNDAMSFELNDAADRLMNFSRRPDQISDSYIRMRPLWVVVDVHFTDIFDAPQRQELVLAEGTPRLIGRNYRFDSVAGLSLHLRVDNRGTVVVHRLGSAPVSPACRDALDVMGRINWLRIARPTEPPQDQPEPFVTELPENLAL